MTNCPVCNSKVDEKAKFCAECGVQLTNAPSERVWIVAMQEKIRSARHNDTIFNVLAIMGILITVAIPFIMRFSCIITWILSWCLQLSVLYFLSAVLSVCGMTIVM